MSLRIAVLCFVLGCSSSGLYDTVSKEDELDGTADTAEPLDPSPRLSDFRADHTNNGIVDVSFVLDDPDGDWGRLELTVDGEVNQLNVPFDITSWAPGELSHVMWPLEDVGGDCDQEQIVTFEGEAVDMAGNRSAHVTDTETFDGTTGTATGQSTEPDDTFTQPTDLGMLAVPAVITGTMDYNGDDDYLMFEICATGSYSFQLSWSDAVAYDIDIDLYDSSFTQLDSSWGVGVFDGVGGSLTEGEIYYVVVREWSAVGVDWTLDVN